MKRVHLLLFSLSALLFIAVCITSCTKKETPAPLIDMKLFFKNGVKFRFRISPDGKYYSYLKIINMQNVYVQKIGDSTTVRVTNDTLRSIYSYFWKGNRIVYLQDIGGDENFQLFSVNVSGSDLKALTPFPGYRTDVLDEMRFIPGKEKEMLIIINIRDKQYFDPYLINIETGELKLMYQNTQNYNSWYTDNKGEIRMATKTDGVNISYMYRNTDKDTFNLLFTASFKGGGFYPISFDSSNKLIYVISGIGRDKLSLVEYNPVTKKELKVLYSDPDYEIENAFYDQKKKVLASVS
jgi:hypothetical protein